MGGHRKRRAGRQADKHGSIKPPIPSAVQKVFNTPELLAMILVKLPLANDCSAMRVCRLFRACLNPYAPETPYRIREALGMEHSRTIKTMDDLDGQQRHCIRMPTQACNLFRLDWLLNINFGFNIVNDHCAVPVLAIKPFTVMSIKGNARKGTVKVALNLNTDDLEVGVGLKGVKTLKRGFFGFWTNNRRGVRHSWEDIKLFKLPFKVIVTVRVDFLKAMGAPSDHVAGTPCSVAGCQAGMFGRQYTNRQFAPEEATLGEFFAFLDRVEWDVIPLWRFIKHVTKVHGQRPHGESFYLGEGSERPPTVQQQYGPEYVPVPGFYGPRPVFNEEFLQYIAKGTTEYHVSQALACYAEEVNESPILGRGRRRAFSESDSVTGQR